MSRSAASKRVAEEIDVEIESGKNKGGRPRIHNRVAPVLTNKDAIKLHTKIASIKEALEDVKTPDEQIATKLLDTIRATEGRGPRILQEFLAETEDYINDALVNMSGPIKKARADINLSAHAKTVIKDIKAANAAALLQLGLEVQHIQAEYAYYQKKRSIFNPARSEENKYFLHIYDVLNDEKEKVMRAEDGSQDQHEIPMADVAVFVDNGAENLGVVDDEEGARL